MAKKRDYQRLRGGGYEAGDVERVQAAIARLREARALLLAAGAVRTARRVRAALSSAAGAERAAYGRRNRAEYRAVANG